MDVPSFIDYFIVSEVSRNVDGYKKSRFFYKNSDDKDSLLRAGPVWDFDWAWKNITECIFGNTDGSGWGYKTNDCQSSYAVPDWHIRLLQDGKFTNQLIERYKALRSNLLDLTTINLFLDSIKTEVSTASKRHFAVFPISDPNAAPEVEPPSKSYDEEITKLKTWIKKRIDWLDINIPKLRGSIMTDADSVDITVVNPSFELPGTEKIKGWDGICSDPNWTGLTYDIPGWSSDAPVFDSGVEQDQTPTDGLWTGFLMGKDTSVYQTSNYVIQSGDAIDLKIDAKMTWQADLLEMTLFYLNGSLTKIPIVSNRVNITDAMQEYSTSFFASDYPAAVGHKLGIMFDNVSSEPQSWLALDNVRLLKRTTVNVSYPKTLPAGFSLSQNYPNPFNPATVINYSLPVNSNVSLKVYDILGREVAKLVSEFQNAGEYRILFSITDKKNLASGIYFYTIVAGNPMAKNGISFIQTKKMILTK